MRVACALSWAILSGSALAAPASAEPVRNAAAPPAAPPAAAAPEPQRTTATFEDWTLRCLRPDRSPSLCEVNQTVANQNRQPIAQTAFGHPPGDPMRFTALLPPNILIGAAPRLVAPDFSVDMTWRRCLSNGCVADAPVTDAQLKRFRDLKDSARIVYQDASGRELSVPFSPKGLSAALDALAKEP